MPSTESEYLYRILSLNRFIQMLETNKWYFAHPRCWDDPYERKVQNALYNCLFAQCWCRKGVSDAMWRIYSPNHLNIRIRVHQDILRRHLNQVKLIENYGVRLNKVKYVTEREYKTKIEIIEKQQEKNITFRRASEHLFLKRTAFEHEAETRVVIFDTKEPEDPNKNGIFINMETKKIVESVLIDPRAPNEYVKVYSHYLKKVLGFSGKVEKSSLYNDDRKIEI